ncbi:MAG: DUF721 domain-containing protein [Desulfovibrionaceae bacterium]|nr:DUF721 domain-containing protein [Desulfovibrionaceae bacterium]
MNRPDDNGRSIQARLAEREKRVRSSAEGLRLLLHRLGGQEQGRLVSLWKNWDRIMGEDVAALGRPLGHKDQTLNIGADNSMALQELSLRAPEILERANATMGSEFFTEVNVLLLQGKTGLAQDNTSTAHKTTPAAPAPPAFEGPPIGGLMGKLSPDSPITRCYETFVALAKK